MAKALRTNQTDPEGIIWSRLRAGNMEGLKFKRQQPIGKYIVDFVCLEKKIIIEIDGGQHNDSMNDQERDIWLSEQGYKVKRFWNNEVTQNLDGVLEVIRDEVTTLS